MSYENVRDMDSYIRRYMPKFDPFFAAVEPLDEYPMIDWDTVPFAAEDQMVAPRVVPPEVKARHPSVRTPMAHDGGPGMRDGKHASRIKYLLREWL